MNYYNNNNSNRNSNSRHKPFCKVCFDAGKTDTAHFIRSSPDKNSIITCPTLLATQCRYCAQTGHTVKYCPTLKTNNNNNNNNNNKSLIDRHTITRVTPNSIYNNTFALLAEDSDDEHTYNNTQSMEYAEQLYAIIFKIHPSRAGKIVGMFLELDNEHLARMLQDSKTLDYNIFLANQILNIVGYTPVKI
jgi:hypothetical protein